MKKGSLGTIFVVKGRADNVLTRMHEAAYIQ